MFNLSLRVHWGFCDQVEVGHYLFGALPVPPQVTSTGLQLRLHNEVPGFRKLIREGNRSSSSDCKCHPPKYDTDVEFYRTIRDQFRFARRVQRFRREVFGNHTVLGMHVRAGNNETGDFGKKNRAIHDLDEWTNRMVGHVKYLATTTSSSSSSSTGTIRPPLLYLATDTPSLLHTMREALKGIMPVVDFPQERPPEGSGVAFGAMGKVMQGGGQACLDGWRSAFMDMVLLSHADIVIAARPSSFVQTMPMMMAFADGNRFCEVNGNATEIKCFDDYREWCCESLGTFFFGDINQRYDYVRVPYDELWTKKFEPVPRLNRNCRPVPGRRAHCLPYDWPAQMALEQEQEAIFQ